MWFILSQVALLILFIGFGKKITLVKLSFYVYLSMAGVFFVALFSGFSYSKELLAAVALMATFCLVYLNASILLRLDEKSFDSVFRVLFFILLVLGLVSLCNTYFLGGIGVPRLGLNHRMIPFVGEPAMYALLFGPIAIWYGHKFNHHYKILTLMSLFGVLFPNLTMILFVTLYVLLMLHGYHMSRWKKVLLASMLLLVMWLLALILGDYLASRVSFDAGSMNLSSLIYVIHWIEIWDVISQVKLLGNGIGQAADISQYNDFVQRVVELYGEDIVSGGGVNAGHFYLSRLAVSLGYGLFFFLFLYFISFVRSFRYARKRHSPTVQLSLLLIVGFFPELFFRTAGLLSFGFFWLILGICALELERTSIYYYRGNNGNDT
tara:strand:- start:66 stop:1199 length:1134 start_codon:yes stop_codon:yes gene_type:complete